MYVRHLVISRLQRSCIMQMTKTPEGKRDDKPTTLGRVGCVWLGLGLTLEDDDGDGLLLLNGLRVGEASVADVVRPAVLRHHVGKIQVSVSGLGHSFIQRQLLEV